MRRTLNQDEIDALFRATQETRKQTTVESSRKVEQFDLRRSGALTSEQVHVVTTLHESLARRLGNSLGAYLRVGFDLNLVSAEQLTFNEFLTRVPEVTYLASLRVLPIDARAAFQADISLVFPIVDLVLGGSGTDQIEPRDLTEIEEQIFETVVTLIARDLQTTWAPVLELDIQVDQRQPYSQFHALMLPLEKILSLSFEIILPDARGTINIALPAVVANALLRKLSVQWSFSDRIPSRETRRRVRERIMEAAFSAELCLPPGPITVRQVLAVEPGYILALTKRAQDPIHLNVSGKPLFLAYPVRSGVQKCARIERRNSIAPARGKEVK